MKKPWYEYPPQMQEIINHFKESREPLTSQLPYAHAISFRHQFYRFVKALRVDPGEATTSLLETGERISVSVIPGRATKNTPAVVEFTIKEVELQVGAAPEPEPEPEPEPLITDEPYDTEELERIIKQRNGE